MTALSVMVNSFHNDSFILVDRWSVVVLIMPGCSVMKDAQDEAERPFPFNVEPDL